MRNRFLFTVVFLSITVSIAFSQNPHFTRDMEGIPLNISIEWGFSPLVHQQAREMGVDIYWNRVENIPGNINIITSNDLKLLPLSVRDESGQRFNWIEYYCDAKYSVWEAEGTDTTSVGYATLERSTSRTEIVHGTNETYIRTKPFAPDTTIMWGPYYYQEIEYIAYEDAVVDTLVTYNADFRLKLERNNSYPQNDTTSDNPLEPICKLLVTKSTLVSTWNLSTVTIDSVILTRDDLPILDQFYTKQIIYDYLNVPPAENIGLQNHRRGIMGGFNGEDYIEFKVVWLGSPGYLLSVDKVTVYDGRGQLLKTSVQPRNLIEAQLSKLSAYQNLIVGQYGIDEPFSIDNFEPIRIVAQIVRDNSQQLYLPFMRFWDGVWQDIGNPYGAQHLSPHKEFFMRTNGLVNIWQNAYMYDQPFPNNTSITLRFLEMGYTDYRDINIMIAAKNYKLAYSIDSLYGVSLQCSEQENAVSHIRDPLPHEVLYNANLALLHGARFFDMYTYYAQRAPGNQEGFTTTGMIDHQLQQTGKWYMWRDVLKPRLHGLFGNTIKQLKPKFAEYRLGFNPSVNYDLNINYIKRVKLGTGQVPEALGTFADIGFFNKPGENGNNYFMLLSRHYTDPNINNYKIEFRDLLNFNNWRLKNYIEGNDVTVVSNTVGYAESPSFTLNRGDAILFSLHPVIKYGGKLIASETAGNGMTLYEPMTIESGATLTINGTYNCLADISVKAGGKIETIDGGTINFSNGSKLIIDGAAQLSGTSSNKLNLNFTTPQNENSVVVTETGALTMTHCSVSNAVNGVKSLSLTGRTIIEKVNFVNCSNSAISILGQVSETESTPPPQIKECVINIPTPLGSQTIYGINVTNLGEVEISYNTIRNSKCGIFLSQVGQAYILQNDISSTTPEMSGIFMHSSSGDIRANSITNHTEGIYLINSSPDIGGNIIHHNKIHGIFSGSGSNPYMVAQLSGVPPVWYILSGYNHIYENGGYLIPSYPALDNDGSEIYINASLVQINDGCNLIYDNRVPEADPAPGDLFNSQILMNGTLSGGRELRAENNFWDVHTLYPLSSRFGSLRVDYTPFRTTPCELPQGDEDYLLAKNSKGEVVDTVYVNGEVPENPSTIQNLYSEAEALFREGSYSAAITKYELIISGEDSVYEKLTAFERLYALGKITDQDAEYFNNLQNIYSNAIAGLEDTLLNKILNQKILLSDVSKGEFVSAINGFDNIIIQNPESEEAMAAEIDIITTSLLIDTSNNQLGKLSNEKYLVKGSSDYMNKLNSILNKHFGIVEEGSTSKIIPTEYTLYQNYPNPFNPSTTIIFDLPKDGNVELIVYDILGRKITQLVNEYRSAGSYEQRFDASNLASGIYIYQLMSGDFISSKKMLMIK